MTTRRPKRTPATARAIKPSLRRRTAIVWKGWDFWVGVGVIAGLCATSGSVRSEGVTALLAEAAVGVAVLGVVLAALAIFSPTFDGLYRRVVEGAGGVSDALRPYMLTSSVGGAAAVLAVVSALAWPILGSGLKIATLGLATLLATWAISGTVSLVGLTLFHARQRSELMGIVEGSDLHARGLRVSGEDERTASGDPIPRDRIG
ncbi:MAG: hypothetical protein ACRDK0_15545 [Solirubrobacteraceae bacterium]